MIDNEFELKNGIYMLKPEVIIPRGFIRLILRDAKTGRIKSDELVKNMIVTRGKESIAQGLWDSAKGMITYCAVGTSAVAPALGDTQLGAEVGRKLISVRSSSNNQALFQTFFTVSEGNGALREAGLFGDDAISAPNSGTLFARAAINRTKSSSDTLTMAWTVIIG